MKIILKGSIRIECPTIDNQTAYLDSVEAVGGYCNMLPAKAWRKDLELDNYTVLQTLTRGHLLLDHKPLEQDSSGEGL